MTGPGPLALVGGDEFCPGCTFDEHLLAAAGGSEVVVLATAAAYERPDKRIDRARSWWSDLGATVVAPPVYSRSDALDPEHASTVRKAGFVYLTGGSPMHLRSVLKDTPVWEAVVAAWKGGAVLAGSGAGGDVLCDYMVDPRGGAFGVGLGLLTRLSMIPRYNTWSPEKVKRTVQLAPIDLFVVGVPEQTALVRETDGSWRQAGVASVAVYRGGASASLDELPSDLPGPSTP